MLNRFLLILLCRISSAVIRVGLWHNKGLFCKDNCDDPVRTHPHPLPMPYKTSQRRLGRI
jgi:hypothetical protein